jgi:hypothetical protein
LISHPNGCTSSLKTARPDLDLEDETSERKIKKIKKIKNDPQVERPGAANRRDLDPPTS